MNACTLFVILLTQAHVPRVLVLLTCQELFIIIIINKLVNCFQFSPVPSQRKPLEGLQVQSPETSMRKRSAPTEYVPYSSSRCSSVSGLSNICDGWWAPLAGCPGPAVRFVCSSKVQRIYVMGIHTCPCSRTHMHAWYLYFGFDIPVQWMR